MKAVVIVFLLALSSVVLATNAPIIGILTQPVSTNPRESYIAASYVKFIEGAGARVVPIFHNSTPDQLKQLFSSINGVLFPGGGSSLDNTPLYKAGAYLYELAKQANDQGDYFPIQGHCMGFELLMTITSQNFSILEKREAENISMPLNLYSGYQNTRLFSSAPQEIINIFTGQPVSLNNHMWGVPPSSFQSNSNLKEFYTPISHNVDINGNVFVSTAEGTKYPVYALQWHAEKPLFEWNNWEDINHSTPAVKAMQYISDFFVSEARKSNHRFPTPDAESAALIYNYSPVYTGKYGGGDFVQTYYFNK